VSETATYRVLVTGCGRSGTRYTTFVLRRLGLDVPHERLGRDGLASWTMAVDARERPFGPSSAAVRFDHVFHQVRHPLAVIRSVATFGPDSWAFVYDHTPCSPGDPLVVRGAKYWLHWTAHADRLATWSYRVEALAEALPELCSRLGVPHRPAVLARVPGDVNTRRRGRPLHLADELAERLRLDLPGRLRERLARETSAAPPPLTWDELAAADPRLAERVRERALAYGYEDA
jgi:hypothetical protein